MNPKEADRSGNCVAGTVVDTVITHPTEFDFCKYPSSFHSYFGSCLLSYIFFLVVALTHSFFIVHSRLAKSWWIAGNVASDVVPCLDGRKQVHFGYSSIVDLPPVPRLCPLPQICEHRSFGLLCSFTRLPCPSLPGRRLFRHCQLHQRKRRRQRSYLHHLGKTPCFVCVFVVFLRAMICIVD